MSDDAKKVAPQLEWACGRNQPYLFLGDANLGNVESESLSGQWVCRSTIKGTCWLAPENTREAAMESLMEATKRALREAAR